MYKRTIFLIILVVLVAGTLLRLAYLTADPPPGREFGPSSQAHAGQYASASRQLVLFGQPCFGMDRFHVMSPLVTGLNYLVYRIFGINLTSHRSLPALFSILCLLLFALLIYRYLGPLVCLFASLLLAFNFPILMFSKAATRIFPMVFFFVISLWLFLKGADKNRISFFIWSALFFCLSFLSRGTILYLILLFLVLGVVWLREKRLALSHLWAFFGVVAGVLVVWVIVLYLPNKEFINGVLQDNKTLRGISGIKQLLFNLTHFPFFSGFRSDPVLPVFTLFTGFLILREKIKKQLHLPPFVEMTLIWFLVGLVVHVPFSYSPLRFIVDLAFPASVLAAYGIKEIWVVRKNIRVDRDFILALFLIAILAVFLGIIPFFKLLPNLFTISIFLPVVVSFVLALGLLYFFKKRLSLNKIFVSLILVVSIAGNLCYFFGWSGKREYKTEHIAGLLKQVIPPATISGRMASLLAIGTPHRTTLTWFKRFNWHPEFYQQTGVQYLLLTDYFPERLVLKEMFKKELDQSRLLAVFKAFAVNFYLLDIRKQDDPGHILEAETFIRKRCKVIYDLRCSQNMALLIEPWQDQDMKLQREFILPDNGNYRFLIHGKGNCRIGVEILDNQRRQRSHYVQFKTVDLTSQAVRFSGLSKGRANIFLKVLPSSGPFLLDRIQFERVADIPL